MAEIVTDDNLDNSFNCFTKKGSEHQNKLAYDPGPVLPPRGDAPHPIEMSALFQIVSSRTLSLTAQQIWSMAP